MPKTESQIEALVQCSDALLETSKALEALERAHQLLSPIKGACEEYERLGGMVQVLAELRSELDFNLERKAESLDLDEDGKRRLLGKEAKP